MRPDGNVQIVRDLYGALARGDMAAAVALLTEDVRLVVPGPPGVGVAGTWHGHDEVQQCFRRLGESQRNEALEIQEIVADDERVVVLLHVVANVLATGKTFESDIVHFFTLNAGRIVSVRDFFDAPALADASSS
jgi:ketosteroid isomerase-like protein